MTLEQSTEGAAAPRDDAWLEQCEELIADLSMASYVHGAARKEDKEARRAKRLAAGEALKAHLRARSAAPLAEPLAWTPADIAAQESLMAEQAAQMRRKAEDDEHALDPDDEPIFGVAPPAAPLPEPVALPEWTRDGIADFIADHWPDRKHTLAEIEAGIRAIEIRPPKSAAAPLLGELPAPCDGKEQEAFEAWAKGAKYSMEIHPLHWLFLDPKTYAARQGWRAALEYARAALSAAQPAQPVKSLGLARGVSLADIQQLPYGTKLYAAAPAQPAQDN